MNPSTTKNACPQNVWNHKDGCTCAPGGALTGEATDVDLAGPIKPGETVADIAASDRYRDTMALWHDTDEPDSLLQDEVAELGRSLLHAAEQDRPARDPLLLAIETWDDLDEHELDAASDIVRAIEDITAKSTMSVVEDGRGGHRRLFDGRAGATCPDCGNGYATQHVLDVHQAQDCTGLDVTRDYSLDRDGYDSGTDSEDTDGDFDEDAHDALHNAADSYASEVNALGRAAQVAFLRSRGVSDDDIRNEFVQYQPDAYDGALDDLVIDTASHAASNAYNDGQDKDLGPLAVRSSLDSGHFRSDEEFEQWFANPEAGPKVWGEAITDDDPLRDFINGDQGR